MLFHLLVVGVNARTVLCQPLLARLFLKPLLQRRHCLEEVLGRVSEPQLVLSQGLIGAGKALFQETYRQHLEGIMAKKLTSSYRPGTRAADWIKIKPQGHDNP